VAAEIVSLPMFPQMTDEQVNEVSKRVKEFVGARVSSIL